MKVRAGEDVVVAVFLVLVLFTGLYSCTGDPLPGWDPLPHPQHSTFGGNKP
jgi:hypothetical protein